MDRTVRARGSVFEGVVFGIHGTFPVVLGSGQRATGLAHHGCRGYRRGCSVGGNGEDYPFGRVCRAHPLARCKSVQSSTADESGYVHSGVR